MYIFDFLSSITGYKIPGLSFFTGFSIFAIIYYILLAIALWKIFQKANEQPWKALIPIYNFIILFRIVGLSPWYILIYLLLLIPNGIVYTVFLLCFLILKIVFAIDLSHSFGRHIGTTLGLFVFPSIFYLILGFGDSVYTGPYGLKN